MAHDVQSSESMMCFSHFDVICDRLQNRRTATWSVFAKCKCMGKDTWFFQCIKSITKIRHRVKYGLDYFLDHFLDHFLDYFLDHFEGGSTPLVLREG